MMSAALLQDALRLAAAGSARSPAVDRRFGLILLLSLALHGVLFAVINGQRQASPVVLPPIFATLRFLAPISSESASESGSAVAAPAPAARATPAIPPKARQFPSRSESPSARPVTPSAGPANVPAPTAPAALAAAASDSSVATTPAVAPSSAARSDSELLDGYRRRLGDLFARQQEYPRIAALRGWEGEVRLRLKVARKGQLLGIHLDRSSGFDVLDQHALAMVEALPGLPPLPEALEANEIQVVVPINYKLKKTT